MKGRRKPSLFILLEVENRGLRAFTAPFLHQNRALKKNVRVAFEKRIFIEKNNPPSWKSGTPMGGDITPNAFRKDVYYEYAPKHDPAP